jgi:hypothetical protein
VISKRTRRRFADFASDFAVLRLIDDVFEAEEFTPRPDRVCLYGIESSGHRGVQGGSQRRVPAVDGAPRSRSRHRGRVRSTRCRRPDRVARIGRRGISAASSASNHMRRRHSLREMRTLR